MFRVIEAPVGVEKFADMRIWVNGEECAGTFCRVSALPLNVWWSGKQRLIEQTEVAGVLSLVADEPLDVIVQPQKSFEGATIRPLHSGVVPFCGEGKIFFHLEKCGQYVLEAGDEHNALHIFVNPPAKFGHPSQATRYFGAGEHDVGKICLHSGDRIFIDEGAYVRGVFYGKGVRDVKIYGYGTVDGGREERKTPHCYEDNTNGCLKLYQCESVTVEGVTFSDSAVWVCNLFACKNVTMDNVKLVGHWKYNCDGIDVVNSSHVNIVNSFVRAFDDAVTLKGIVTYREHPVKDITVKNCVFWCGWGRTLEIGLETVADEYSDILFENCDLIHNSAVAMDIQAGDYAEIHDVVYRDIRVEYQAATLPEVMDNPLGKAYDRFGETAVPELIKITSPYYEIEDEVYVAYNAELHRVRQGRTAVIHDIFFQNITVYLEKGVRFPKIILDVAAPSALRSVTIEGVQCVEAESSF